jgi:type VI secretion system FHA domain protein
MALVLRVVAAGSCPVTEGETRICDADTFTIGRGNENDWIIADPERHLSKQHCRFERRDGGYYVVDTSRNGVFVGASATPLGTGNGQLLKDGDDIDLGPCAVRVEIVAGAGAVEPTGSPAPWPTAGATPVSRRFGLDDTAPASGFAVEPAGDGVEAEQPSAVAVSFALPTPQRATIPTNWQAEDAEPTPVTAQDPAEVSPPPSQATPAPPLPPSNPASGPVAGDLLASFLTGAGLPLDAVLQEDAADTMHKLGLAFREAIGGLRELLELRAFLKSEFHIEHTRLRAKENNPLKFSANLDGTLSVLLGRRVPGFMTPPEAIRESLRDVKAHEVALIAGMKAVVGDLLEQLSPETVKASVENALLPQVYKARCWERFEQMHQRLAGDQASGPPLGSRFAQAYTQQFRTI